MEGIILKKQIKNLSIVLMILFIITTFGNVRFVNAATNNLRVSFIDVGQADSILIQQGNQNMLI